VRRGTAVAAVIVLGVAGAAAAELPLRVGATPDPLRSASLPFDPVTAAELRPGEWRVEVSAAYANLWQGTWQTAAIHAELGRWRQPVGSDELREIERRYPNTDMYRVDLEAWRTDVIVQRGFGSGLVLTVDVPWLDVGTPHWDAVGEWWHAHLGMPSANRPLFPRSQTLLYVYGPAGTIEQRGALDGGGVGDVSCSLGAPLGEVAGAASRIVVAVEAPTGKAGTLRGSGGWDAGLRWVATWRWDSGRLRLGAGYTWLDSHGSLLGVERADTAHGWLGAEQSLGKGWQATASFSYESSPLARITHTALGQPAALLRLGLGRRLGDRSWWALDMDQDWYNVGVAPDYGFRLTFGTATR
jgi:hypothetical protein